jgi:hypothetical protein
MLAAERSAELAAQEHLADRPRTVSAHGGD